MSCMYMVVHACMRAKRLQRQGFAHMLSPILDLYLRGRGGGGGGGKGEH